MNLFKYSVACLLALFVLSTSAFSEIKEQRNIANRNGDFWQRVRIIMKDAPRATGLDTIVDTERDTSNETYNFAGADNVQLYTLTDSISTSDTLFVNALVVDPWDSTGFVTVPLDTIISAATLLASRKDVASLVNIYNALKIELIGGNTAGADTVTAKLSVDAIWKSR